MGIRLYKAIGYGIKFEKPNFDSRLSIDLTNGDDTEALYERSNELTLKDLNVYLKLNAKNKNDDIQRRIEFRKIDFDNDDIPPLSKMFSLISNPDQYLGMYMIPMPSYRDWVRKSDPIDYFDASLKDDPTEERIVLRTNPIYPYSGYMNARTGKPVVDLGGGLVGGMMAKDMVDADSQYVHSLGFKDVEDFKENFVSEIPQTVRAAYELLEIFKDNNMINQVRPLLAEWWS